MRKPRHLRSAILLTALLCAIPASAQTAANAATSKASAATPKTAAPKSAAAKSPAPKTGAAKIPGAKTPAAKTEAPKATASSHAAGKIPAPKITAAKTTAAAATTAITADKEAKAENVEKASDPATVSAKSAADAVQKEIESKGWKKVNVPLPPVLDKALRIAAIKNDKDKAAKAKSAEATEALAEKAEAAPAKAKTSEVAPGIPAVSPPQPKATGIFALFAQGNPDAGAANGDGAVVRPPATANAFARIEGPSTRVASLTLPNPLRAKPMPGTKNDDLEDEEEDAPTPGAIRKQIDSVQTNCLQPQLLAMVKKAGEHFGGEAIITSGFRARGRRGSYHRRCAAVDFQIPGVAASQLVAYLRKMPGAGGVGTYCHTKSVHLDTGTPRDWHQCMFHRRFALRSPVGQ